MTEFSTRPVIALLAAVPVFVSVAGDALAVDDNKILPGSMCTTWNTVGNQGVLLDELGFKNPSSANMNVTCPIVRDQTESGATLQAVWVRAIHSGSATTSCTVINQPPSMNSSQSGSVEQSTGSGAQSVVLSGSELPSEFANGTTSVNCTVPPSGIIQSVRWRVQY